ncbi:MAG: ATP-binding protein [Prevotellaceae bacterium]|jgi:AAA+ ATPase superfamily predicted ATPase|nr:ATP-binding protein [Prevotellaceae bacterium]
MEKMVIGRTEEQKRLQELYGSGKSEFVAIYGRRRVGKTFLIRQMFENDFVFDLVGLANSNTQKQLLNFTIAINRSGDQGFLLTKNWLLAFEQLRALIEQSQKKRKVIFIDEIPWLDTPYSGFISALEHFWNGWACWRRDVMMVVCGSATSWIINKLINNHGGLHNRITATIHLQPFTLFETKQFLKSQGIEFGRLQIAECYMVMGGIPYYLSKLKRGLSLAQNIDNIFFARDAELKNEFKNLYASLFRNATDYVKIVEALSKKGKGLTRSQILEVTKLPSGGTYSQVLQNLESCGFIRRYSLPTKQKREVLYQLLDPFTLFYFKYIDKSNGQDEHLWENTTNTPQHNAWAGYAFEILSMQHINEIKRALGILGVQTSIFAWRSEHSLLGAQIDLVIDRKDGIINLCEIKFCRTQYAIDKDYEEKLRNKIAAFQTETKTKKAIHLLMLTTFGLQKNKYFGIAQKEVVLDDLF